MSAVRNAWKQFSVILLCAVMLLSILPIGISAAGHTMNTEEWQVLLLTNRERLKEGLSPVTSTDLIQQACDIRAEEINTLFSHDRPNGSDCFSLLDELPFPWVSRAGENISAGRNNSAEVVNAWMNSSGHRANILRGEFIHMGAGYYLGGAPYGKYWVQMFYTGSGCSYSAMSLMLPSELKFALGTSIDDMGITAKLTCDTCGDTYLPVMTELCRGYDPDKAGPQTITVTCFGLSQTVTVNETVPPVTDPP